MSRLTSLALAALAASALAACGGDDGEQPPDTCSFGSATSLAAPGELDLFGEVASFSNGDALPAGRYRVTYVDGCMKYGGGQAWTVHAYAQEGPFQWWLVGETTADRIAMPPGTAGYSAANGAFDDFEACVTANAALAPLELDFEGGQLGVWLLDAPYTDNVAGVEGRNPTWKLEKLGGCE